MEVYAKKAKIKEDLLDLEAISALLEDDEVAALDQLNADLKKLNYAAYQCGRDMNYGGTTGEDVLRCAKRFHDSVDEALSLVRSRYTIRHAMALDAADSPDAG